MHRVDLATGTHLGSSSTHSLAYPIAVVDTVRLGHRDNSSGQEYDLDGVATGVTWSGGTPISQLLDGTTDGTTYNYGATCCSTQAVYRFDRLWGNAELLFNVDHPTGSRGITYDPVNGTLWLLLFNGNLIQYDLSGGIISTTSALSTINLVALSYDGTSDSFWAYNRGNTFYNFDRSGNVLGTVVVEGFSTSNVYGGEIVMSAPSPIPEPSSFTLAFLGIAGLLVYQRRKNSVR